MRASRSLRRALSVKSIGVIGSGLMGAGIAQVSAVGGFNVVLVDSSAAVLEKSTTGIKESLELLARKEAKKAGVDAKDLLQMAVDTYARISRSTKLGDLSDVDLVIEAVPETMQIKTPIYKELGAILRSDAIIASNTSGLSIAELAGVVGRPQTTIGLHYFNPVPLMALCEVVQLPSTLPDVLESALSVVKQQGKTSVVVTDTPGFVVNRLLVPFLAQAIALAEAGVASVEDIDAAMKLGAGHPMGPLQLADYVGLDTTLNILTNWHAMYPSESAFFVPKLLSQKVDAGLLGRKSGQGFYKWAGNKVIA